MLLGALQQIAIDIARAACATIACAKPILVLAVLSGPMMGPMRTQAPSSARFSTLMVSGSKGAASSSFRAFIGQET